MRVPIAYLMLLVWLTACATPTQRLQARVLPLSRLANLQRAAALPWKDDGRCVVAESSQPWPLIAERCFHALDTRRVRFHDLQRRCPVASADAATLQTMVGVCLLAQPELVVGVVVVIGAVVVAAAIVQAINEYPLKETAHRDATTRKKAKGVPVAMPTPTPDPEPSPKAVPSPLGPDVAPPTPDDEDPACTPARVPHLGGNAAHNLCADRVPLNDFSGSDALVSGKHFDAVQLSARVLWEVKTDNYETYPPYVQEVSIKQQVAEMKREKALAEACGYFFKVGVKSAAHKQALVDAVDDLDVIVMDWC